MDGKESHRKTLQRLRDLPEPPDSFEANDVLARARREFSSFDKSQEKQQVKRQQVRKGVEDTLSAFRDIIPLQSSRGQTSVSGGSAPTSQFDEDSIWGFDNHPKKHKLTDYGSGEREASQAIIGNSAARRSKYANENAQIIAEMDAMDRNGPQDFHEEREERIAILERKLIEQRKKLSTCKKPKSADLKKADVLQGLVSGIYSWEEGNNDSTFSVVLDQNEMPTDHRICNDCCEMLTGRGGHLGRHQEYCEAKNKRPIPVAERKCITHVEEKEIAASVAQWILREGKPFAICEADSFKNMIAEIVSIFTGVTKEEVVNKLPSRKVVARLCMTIADEIIAESTKKFLLSAKNEEVSLQADHGKHQNTDYLSLFGSHLLEETTEWQLETLPLGLSEVKEGKKTSETFTQIVDMCEKIGMSEPLVKNCFLTTDGALKKVGADYMKQAVVCVNHSISLISERTLDPYHKCRADFLIEEREMLGDWKKLVERCSSLVFAIRNSHQLTDLLGFIPKKPAPTRWLSNYGLLMDMTADILPALAKETQNPQLSKELKDEIHDLNRNLLLLQQIACILEFFVPASKAFQTSSRITAHLVLPFYTHLKKQFKLILKDQMTGLKVPNDDNLKLMAKGALSATMYQFDKNIGDVHYAADYLNPNGMFDSIDDDVRKEKTIKYIEILSEKFDNIPIRRRSLITKKAKSFYDRFAGGLQSDDDEEEEEDEEQDNENSLQNEIKKYDRIRRVRGSPPPERFWIMHKEDLPLLYKVAKVVYACVPSEAVCERSFSILQNIVTKQRSRLEPLKTEKQTIARMLTAMKTEKDPESY